MNLEKSTVLSDTVNHDERLGNLRRRVALSLGVDAS